LLSKLSKLVRPAAPPADVEQAATPCRGSLDTHALDELSGIFSPEQMGEYLDLFRTNKAERLSHLAAYASANNWKELAGEAHAIAGTAGTIGALELSRAARELENACKNGAEPAILRSIAEAVQALAGKADKELSDWFETQTETAA
jgi:HPt (histidine-containing phosphotransfer) domain-containing protein